MFTRKALLSSFGRTAALATVAALALTVFEPSTAQARYRGGGGAAAAAAFAGIVGTGLAIAATQDRGYYGGPAYYDGGPAYGSPYDSYGYYGGPPAAYYGGGPAYYGGGGYGYGGSSRPYFRGHRIPDGG